MSLRRAMVWRQKNTTVLIMNFKKITILSHLIFMGTIELYIYRVDMLSISIIAIAEVWRPCECRLEHVFFKYL